MRMELLSPNLCSVAREVRVGPSLLCRICSHFWTPGELQLDKEVPQTCKPIPVGFFLLLTCARSLCWAFNGGQALPGDPVWDRLVPQPGPLFPQAAPHVSKKEISSPFPTFLTLLGIQ